MKIRAFFVSVLILCSLTAAIFYLKAAQPLSENKMITEAIQGKNTPQLIKALIIKMKGQLEVDEDNFPALIHEVENYTAECPDSASVAVLHSMLAEMYNRYFMQNQWKYNQRTAIVGFVPDDIREWSSNLFTEKVKEELKASLQPASLLQNTPISEFKEILIPGKDSPQLRPSLFDFLAFRALDIQPSAEIYSELTRYLNTQPDKKAALLAELDKLQYTYQQLAPANWRNKYMSALDSLNNLYAGKDYSVEIVVAKLNVLEMIPMMNINDSIRRLQYSLCQEGISRYPNYERIGILKNRLAELQKPNLTVRADNNVYPGSLLKIKLTYTNLPQVTVSVYKSLKTFQQTIPYYYAGNNPQSTLGELVKKVILPLPLPDTYNQQDTTLTLPMETPGLYECVITSDNQQIKTNNLFSVSRLAALSRNQPNGKTEILVTDFESGKPIHDASVMYYSGQRNNLREAGSVKTDKDGLAILPAQTKMFAYKATRPGDTASLLTSVYPDGRIVRNQEARTIVSLFTDRGIYRPGQTVFFKGIAYVEDTDTPHVMEGETFSVIFRDANSKEIATKQFKTNKFGSFNGEFTIPQQTLNGGFTLSTDNGSTYIRVEEYKRPTFQVELLPVKGDITFGDQVTINGKAQTYSGVALQSGKVTYRVIRVPFWYRNYLTNPIDEQVAEGNMTVSSEGTFSFRFRPEKAANQPGYYPYQSYLVSVSLTDSKGETQETTTTLSVGEASLVLTTNLQQQMEKDSVKAIVTARTLNGETVPVNGTFTIYSLLDTPIVNKYKEGTPIAQGTFVAGKEIDPQVFSSMPSGRFRMKLETKDTQGRPVQEEQDFILYGKKDKRPPVFSHTWVLEEKTTCLPGEEAEIIFGTSDKKAFVLYEVFSNNTCLLRKRIELSDENRSFRFPFLNNYGDGVVATFTFVKEGRLYTVQVPVKRQLPDRKLTIKPETFRDRLLPGSQETWKFRILDADSVAVEAEMLASMYDASLDQILPFNWYFSPQRYITLYAPLFNESYGFNTNNQYSAKDINFVNVPEYQYDRLNWQSIMEYGGGNRVYATTGALRMKSAAPNVLQESMVMQADVNPMMAGKADAAQLTNSAEAVSTPQIRENFNETAFFYPSLLTDQQGNVSLQFTLPQSNTTWKFQALAHTTDLKYGLLTREVISSKPLMVLPNLPRFMRQGDEVSVSTQVINHSAKAITGRVSLELFDPATNQPIVCLTKSQRPFSLEANQTTTVSWTFTVPSTTDLMGCRIVADSNDGSDGEQVLIPVLSDKILVTESTPFYLIEEGEKQIRIPQGDAGSRTPFSMTLELTSNPIWYAVQALPTVTQPSNDNIIAWFGSYYSNTLADYIATANPRIQTVISQWTAKGGTASTLYSNLQKNEELKNILLAETPWVLEADNETEQKQRLSLLFDLNRAQQQREVALQQLLQQQDEEGGWSWFKGMMPSREMTLFILKGMSQLVEMNAIQYGQEEKMMQMKALKYLDKQIQLDYEQEKKYNKNLQNSSPTPLQLEYLYIRSAYRDIPELGEAREAIRFYTAQAEKFWNNQSLYGKGEIALLMHQNGKKEVATAILTWLRKTATTTSEKGMYWANNRRESNYFISPIDTHCLLMKVFNSLAPDTQETDRMKQWLLNQKQTQNWESTPSTLNAIYALLLTGSDWLNQNNTCIVQWGNQTYNTSQGEAATGYIKEVVRGKEITPQMNIITVRKEGNTPAWGAVYNQYFESINTVGKQKGVLNVEKKLFIETNNGSEQQIRPVTEEQLRVGDKVIVRLTIRTDREMDYVYLKDLRAGCFEPASQLSGSAFRDGVWYYQSPKDVSENFFFSRLPQGTFVIEYPVFVSRTGEYAGGISTIQCLYAPEFVSHTEGNKIVVND